MKILVFFLTNLGIFTAYAFPIPEDTTKNMEVAWIKNTSKKKNCAFLCRAKDNSVNFAELGTGIIDIAPRGVYPVFVCKAEVSIPELGYKGFLFGHNKFSRISTSTCKIVTPDNKIHQASDFSCLCIKYEPRL